MKIKSIKKFFFFTFLLLVVLYLFWGPLFPWNPLKPGFEKIKLSKATLYITKFNGENVVCNLDEILQEEEEFHGIGFKEKFKIIILGKENNMKRFQAYLKSYIINPKSYKIIFPEVYNEGLKEILQKYNAYMNL